MSNIKIFLEKDTFQPPVKLVQFDKGFTLTFEVYNPDGTPHVFNNDEHIEFDVRINNNILLASSNDEFSLNGNLAMWTLKRELTVNNGKGIFTFSVCNSKTNSRISSFVREIIIGNAALNEDSINTEVFLTVIEELKRQIANGELIITDLEGQSSSYQKRNDNKLQTTSKEVIGAINELFNEIGTGVGIDERVGILEDLTTIARVNIVTAINEINSNSKKNTTSISGLNESIAGLQTGYKIPVLTESPVAPASGEMWILKSGTVVNEGSIIDTYEQVNAIILSGCSKQGNGTTTKMCIVFKPQQNIKLFDLKVKMKTDSTEYHVANNSITVSLYEVESNVPTTLLNSKVFIPSSSLASDTQFDLSISYSNDNIMLASNKTYCIELSLVNPLGNSSYYVMGISNGSNGNLHALTWRSTMNTYTKQDTWNASVRIRKEG